MTKTYYNEFDPKAAAWLRELIAGGHIPAGDVDTRSIVDVKPEDLYGYEQCHFFAGIGGWAYALQLAGWSGPVWSGSCPCQPFSVAGSQRGTTDERHLWPQFARLIAKCQPPVVFGEQVASKAGREWLAGVRADLEGMAYAVGAADLCAAGVGSPHIRQRLFWVADADSPRLEGRRLPELRERAGERVAGSGGDVGGVADDRSWGCEVEVQQRSSSGPEDGRHQTEISGGGCPPCGVGIAYSAGRDSGESAAEGPRHGGSSEPTGGSRRVEHAPGDGWVERGSESSGRGASGGRESRGVAHPHQGECGRIADGKGGKLDRQTTGWEQGDSQPEPSRVDGGFWSSYELIPCRDGKVRRIEPGTFPLAHGVSGRVGLLRGYGNAIVPQVAAEFVAAFSEGRTCDVLHGK